MDKKELLIKLNKLEEERAETLLEFNKNGQNKQACINNIKKIKKSIKKLNIVKKSIVISVAVLAGLSVIFLTTSLFIPAACSIGGALACLMGNIITNRVCENKEVKINELNKELKTLKNKDEALRSKLSSLDMAIYNIKSQIEPQNSSIKRTPIAKQNAHSYEIDLQL